ncbi:hypothetical protein ONS95_013092 [Cadophora gregata]|uniref:uncharacterized protein n=1 Tax=Cadophora gregata TaxID=51156 RepID=UPI0026DC0070|nr:uncharacterized protein ONS95_013092 [Cadophora gregata]KAK0100096.1 hypothetical protein ONS96_008031 [Cadophora gregata f. sp. sojae]KAK0116060.1 hypothetical protein ONS95_013092 [Cadophora gregata]
MSTDVPSSRHRHTRSAAMPPATASSQSPGTSQNPQNPHHLNAQAHTQNTQNMQNDMRSNFFQPPTTPPRTPRKDNQPTSQNTSSSAAPETGSKQRSRNKNRPKNVMTSPVASRKDRNTPPLTGGQSAGMPSSAKPINTPSTAAYAGSTFHASPAPSALPIPSFYSKSVPDSPGIKGLKSLKGAPFPTTDSTPTRTTPSIEQMQREESPLDLFFKADREERARSASSTQALAAANGPFPPPLESPRNSQTPPARSTQSRARQNDSNRISASGMFAMELDGDRAPGTPVGPAFSTPYSERINAARSGGQLDGSYEQSQQHTQSSADRSEALKAYLFSGLPPVAPNSVPRYSSEAPPSGHRSAGTPNRQQTNGYQSGPEPRMMNGSRAGRSSGLRQEVTPTKTPTKTPDRNNVFMNSLTPSRLPANAYTNGNEFTAQRTSRTPMDAPTFASNVGNSDPTIKGMEDSLRRILKLEPPVSSDSDVTQGPAASGSSLNYVGGRTPQMSGSNNGIMRS